MRKEYSWATRYLHKRLISFIDTHCHVPSLHRTEGGLIQQTIFPQFTSWPSSSCVTLVATSLFLLMVKWKKEESHVFSLFLDKFAGCCFWHARQYVPLPQTDQSKQNGGGWWGHGYYYYYYLRAHIFLWQRVTRTPKKHKQTREREREI